MADAYGAPEVGIYKRNILRKHAFKQEKRRKKTRFQSRKKERKHALNQEKKKKENGKEKSNKQDLDQAIVQEN